MNIQQALKILGLNQNCTEEELKRAYKNLAKKHHPDLFQNANNIMMATSKMQDINEAYEIVKNYLKHNNKTNINSNLMTLKTKYQKEVLDEIQYITKVVNQEDTTFLIFATSFRELIYDYFYEKLRYVSSIESLNKLYSIYSYKYMVLLRDYGKKLANGMSVNVVYLFNMIGLYHNRKITLREFRNNVLDVINNILDKELEKYKYLEDYDIIEPLLIKIRNNYAKVCIQGYNLELLKKNLNKRLKIVINKYYKRKKLLDELIEYDGTVLPYSVDLYNNILDEKQFYNIYNSINRPNLWNRIGKSLKKIVNKN